MNNDRLNETMINFDRKANECCYHCKKAAGGCSWSKNFEPIEGWNAEKTVISSNNYPVESYQIYYCPEFEKGEPLDDNEMNMDGALRLLEKVFESAGKEFKYAVKEKLKAEKELETCDVIRSKQLQDVIKSCEHTMNLNKYLLGKHCKRLKRIATAKFIAENAK